MSMKPVLRMVGALCLLMSGCALEPQAQPEPVQASHAAPVTPPPRSVGSQTVRVYLIQGDRLTAVRRSVQQRSFDDALEALVAGPTRDEVLVGKRTAIAPQMFTGAASETSSEVAVVEAPEEFSAISGETQLLAVAQLVWTVTEVPGIRRVRLSVNGSRVEMPTDRGLVRHPVGRSAFASVRPSKHPR